MGIGAKLEAWMEKKKTNANELAQKIGITSSTLYSMMQRDSSRVDIDLIIKIAHALGITADELLYGPDNSAHTHYTNPDTADIAQKIYDNPNMRVLFDAAKDVDPADMKLAAEMLKRMKETNPDG